MHLTMLVQHIINNNMLINYLLVMQSTQAWLSSCPAVQESLFRTGEQEALECSGVLLEQQTTTTKPMKEVNIILKNYFKHSSC